MDQFEHPRAPAVVTQSSRGTKTAQNATLRRCDAASDLGYRICDNTGSDHTAHAIRPTEAASAGNRVDDGATPPPPSKIGTSSPERSHSPIQESAATPILPRSPHCHASPIRWIEAPPSPIRPPNCRLIRRFTLGHWWLSSPDARRRSIRPMKPEAR